MTLSDLDKSASYYVATPYTKYPLGPVAAYMHACRLAGHLINAGITDIFCPIAHGHGMSVHGDVPAFDGKLWALIDRRHVERMSSLIVGQLPGWDESEGVATELTMFSRANKPIFYLDPATLEVDTQPLKGDGW